MSDPVKFKEPQMKEQYEGRHALLKAVCADFVDLSRTFGIEPVVTRVLDKVECESGVHPAGRAVDFRDEYDAAGGRVLRLYTEQIVRSIVVTLNARYARTDGYPTCYHHCVPGGKQHFHIQVGLAQIAEFDRKLKEEKKV